MLAPHADTLAAHGSVPRPILSWAATRRVAAHRLAVLSIVALAGWSVSAADASTRGRLVHLAEWNLTDRPTNASVVIRESVLGADGRARVRFDTGSVRVEYQPAWSSRDRMAAPGYGWGDGPGHWVTLFETGAPGRGGFALAIDPAGTNLVFTTRNAAGATRTNLQARISWTYLQPRLRGDSRVPWREVALNYAPLYSAMFVDGEQQADWLTKSALGTGVYLPQLGQARDARLAVGGSLAEDANPAGRFGTVETFPEMLTPMQSQVLLARRVLSATVQTNPVSVTLNWAGLPGTTPVVRRRPWGQTNWVTLSPAAAGNRFTDSDAALQPGQLWEYTVDNRTIVVALNRPPVEDRGRVLVLVDETLARRLGAALNQFTADLTGDGWQVVQRTAPRHDDHAWDRGPISQKYLENLRSTKSLIRSEYAAPGGLNAIILVGHVTIPYAGLGAEDGHLEINGAWPADAYYGDLDQEWSDALVNAPLISDPVLRNVPGDGKLDPSAFNSAAPTGQPLNGLEVAVGRLDFANLPAFRPAGEVDLLRRYLEKNHRYRIGELTFAAPAVIGGFFYSPFNSESQTMYQNGAWTLSRLIGTDWSDVRYGDAFAPGVSALWGMQGGYGNPTTLHNSAEAARAQGIEPVTSATLAARRTGPVIGFHLLKGSYFGNWNLGEDSFMRAVLAVPDGGLASLWTREMTWRTELLGVGEPLGSALVLGARDGASTRTTYVLGDPTLRMAVLPPPANVKAARANGSVRLTWSPAPRAESYNVYRAASATGPCARLNREPLTTTEFTDAASARGRQFYQVRALALTTTGSGAYTNLSQAAVVTVE